MSLKTFLFDVREDEEDFKKELYFAKNKYFREFAIIHKRVFYNTKLSLKLLLLLSIIKIILKQIINF